MIALAVVVLLAAETPAAATPYERAVLEYADFSWVETPRSEDFERFYPETTGRKLETLIVLRCTVANAGRLERCVVEQAPDRDYGFAKATLRLANKFRIDHRTRSGESTRGRVVRVPVRWMVP